jgi:hypothetical protein
MLRLRLESGKAVVARGFEKKAVAMEAKTGTGKEW